MNWKLEERLCACGCGGTWKCLPTSRNLYASEQHKWASKKLKDKLGVIPSFIDEEDEPLHPWDYKLNVFVD